MTLCGAPPGTPACSKAPSALQPHAPCCASGLVSQLMHGDAVHPHAVQARVRRVTVVGEHLHNRVRRPSDRRYAPGPLKEQTRHDCINARPASAYTCPPQLQHSPHTRQRLVFQVSAATHPHRVARPAHQAALVLGSPSVSSPPTLCSHALARLVAHFNTQVIKCRCQRADVCTGCTPGRLACHPCCGCSPPKPQP